VNFGTASKGIKSRALFYTIKICATGKGGLIIESRSKSLGSQIRERYFLAFEAQLND
jgi:hypothetical protein